MSCFSIYFLKPLIICDTTCFLKQWVGQQALTDVDDIYVLHHMVNDTLQSHLSAWWLLIAWYIFCARGATAIMMTQAKLFRRNGYNMPHTFHSESKQMAKLFNIAILPFVIYVYTVYTSKWRNQTHNKPTFDNYKNISLTKSCHKVALVPVMITPLHYT